MICAISNRITGLFDEEDRAAVRSALKQGFSVSDIITALENAETFYKNNNMEVSRKHGTRLKTALILKDYMTITGFLNYDHEKAAKKVQKLQSRFQAVFNARKHLFA